MEPIDPKFKDAMIRAFNKAIEEKLPGISDFEYFPARRDPVTGWTEGVVIFKSVRPSVDDTRDDGGGR